MFMPVNNYPKLPTILALHGTASTGQQWQALSKDTKGNHTVIAPDLPGYGGSPLTTEPGLSARLAPLIEQLKTFKEPMHLVGHSFGGGLALRLAQLMPEKFLSLTVYEPTWFTILNAAHHDKNEYLANIKQLGQQIANANNNQAMSFFINFWMGANSWSSLSEQSQKKLTSMAHTASQDFTDVLFEIENSHQYQHYLGPTQIMYGENTVAPAKRVCTLLAEQLPNAYIQAIPGLGHMGPIQTPEKVNTEILKHIKNYDPHKLKTI
jgi:pimeloyl-ACP methyl ester carboxylesterase